MATLNLGQVRPVYRGTWNSIDTYVAYDFVIYNGSAYLALKDVPANYEPPSQTEYWVLFGAVGKPGVPGAAGKDGAKGDPGPALSHRWDGTFLSIQNPDGTFPDQGIDLQGPAVPLSNSVTSTSETNAASSKAVNIVYNLANSKQDNLGFTPVQQGGGTGQGSNKICIGYSERGLKAQADTLDLGNVVTTSAGCTKAPSAALADKAALADNATNARSLVVTGDGQVATFHWAGRSTGQPEWVWGGNSVEFGNMYTWNPVNFSVNYATNSSNAWQTTIVPNVRAGDSNNIPAGGTWTFLAINGGQVGYGAVAGGTYIAGRWIAIRNA